MNLGRLNGTQCNHLVEMSAGDVIWVSSFKWTFSLSVCAYANVLFVTVWVYAFSFGFVVMLLLIFFCSRLFSVSVIKSPYAYLYVHTVHYTVYACIAHLVPHLCDVLYTLAAAAAAAACVVFHSRGEQPTCWCACMRYMDFGIQHSDRYH